MRTIFIIIAAVTIGFSVPAYAKSAAYLNAVAKLEEINRRDPAQSGNYKRAADVLSARLLDKTNRVVGEVRNIMLDGNGTIEALEVDFDRLNLRTGPLTIPYSAFGIRPATNGYKMSRRDDDIKNMVPDLLAGIETAAGNASNRLDLKTLPGRALHDTKGGTFANIKSVLFDSTGQRAELLIIDLKPGSVRKHELAIPFHTVRMRDIGTLTVSKTYAEAVRAFTAR